MTHAGRHPYVGALGRTAQDVLMTYMSCGFGQGVEGLLVYIYIYSF